MRKGGNILIFINDSLGELDWIAPFIKSEEGDKFIFYIYLNGPGNSYAEKMKILSSYDLKKDNIFLLNTKFKLDSYLFKLDNFMNKALNKIKIYSYGMFTVFRSLLDVLRGSFGVLFKANQAIRFDFIFRDYNLKDSFVLSRYIKTNIHAKIIIFPHSIGIQKAHIECPRELVEKVKSDLWLENSRESNLVLGMREYQKIFYVTGSPTMGENYNKESLFDSSSKNILILTRICISDYGFTHSEGLAVFHELLLSFDKLGLRAIIKHHPRDERLNDWKEIQNKFLNTEEYSGSLNDIKVDLKACFSLFSSAPLYVLSRQVPVFEVSPYKKCVDYNRQMPFHFCGKSGFITHDFLELELYERILDLNNIVNVLEKEYLQEVSKKQFKRCVEIFPSGANKKIRARLEDMR